jgi:hypothetical protein
MDIFVGTPSPEQAVRRSDWGAHILVRPKRCNGVRGPTPEQLEKCLSGPKNGL